MIVDTLLWLFGRDPSNYYSEDKWPTFLAVLTDNVLIPLIGIVLFILPFLIAWKIFKKLTIVVLISCFIIGAILLYLGHLANVWSLGYGLGVIHGAL